MKDDNNLDVRLKQFYNSSQNYLERLEKHDERTFGLYVQTCKEIISTGSSVLDCGCGTGLSSYLLAESGFHVTGIDLSSLFISQARRRYVHQPNLNFLIGDVSRMPFHSNSFDAVCSFDLMEHVTNVKGALKEMCRLVKTGGSVIVIMPNYLHSDQHLNRCIRWKTRDHYRPWEARSRVTAFCQYFRTVFLTIVKAANINKKIYYLEPVLQDDQDVCGADFDATWLTNRFDLEHILKELGVSIINTGAENFEDRIVCNMRRLRFPKSLQQLYIKMRFRCVVVGVKK